MVTAQHHGEMSRPAMICPTLFQGDAMKNSRRFPALFTAVALVALAGCSDSTGPDGDGQADVTVQGEMTTGHVAMAASKGDPVSVAAGAVADSLVVTRVRVMISELKLHRDKDDSTGGDRTLKSGPMLLTIDSAGGRVVAAGTVPAGAYDKLKFEFHRLSGSEVATYLNDSLFAPFVTDDRYTFIVEGRVYNGGVAFPFTYRSTATANLTLKFEPSAQLSDAGASIVVLRVDPAALFRSGTQVLDPRDGGNRARIDDAIRDAIKALKK